MADDLSFVVELWDADATQVERVLSRNANVSIGRGAFERAARMYPDRVILLRDGVRVIERHPQP
jgi:hypothetical protein